MRQLITLAIASAVSAVAAAAQPMYPVPDAALDVDHVVLQPGIIEQDYFYLTESYPGASAVDHYRNVFSKWRACFWNDRGWSSFGDASGQERKFIHQLARHWVSPRNDVAVTLILRYTSAGLDYRAVPDNERQFVVLLRRKSRNAEKALGEIGAKCEKASNSSLESRHSTSAAQLRR